MTVTLNLTEDQAEILGFALTTAMRNQSNKADAAKKPEIASEFRQRARKIEELRYILDAA